MKINFIPTIISLAISFLIAYGFYSIHKSDNKSILIIGSFLFLAVTLILAVGIGFDLPKTTINIKVTAVIFFALAFFSNLIFTYINFSVQSYLIINGILFLAFVLIAFSIDRVKQ